MYEKKVVKKWKKVDFNRNYQVPGLREKGNWAQGGRKRKRKKPRRRGVRFWEEGLGFGEWRGGESGG